jgi:hypothetical protein
VVILSRILGRIDDKRYRAIVEESSHFYTPAPWCDNVIRTCKEIIKEEEDPMAAVYRCADEIELESTSDQIYILLQLLDTPIGNDLLTIQLPEYLINYLTFINRIMDPEDEVYSKQITVAISKIIQLIKMMKNKDYDSVTISALTLSLLNSAYRVKGMEDYLRLLDTITKTIGQPDIKSPAFS